MKKIFKNILCFALFILLSSNIVFGNEPIKVYVDNELLKLENSPLSIDGNTLVPVRSIFENLGAEVEWDGQTQTVTGKKDNKTIKLIINDKNAKVNESLITLNSPAQIINGSTYVPARFVAESLGAQVEWDSNTRSVLVNSKYPYGKYKVVRVVDGDTLIVNFNDKEERVRLIGVDTPESVHPDASKNIIEGQIASEYTKALLEGKEIALEFDVQERDHYGRLLAYAWFNGEMYNKTLLEEGYAKTSTYPPNVKYVAEFTEIERTARINNKGLWSYEETQVIKEEMSQAETGDILKVKAGEDATVSLKLTPNTEYNIYVYYSSGLSKAKGLETKTSDKDGNISWTWKVGTKTNSGEYRIIVKGDREVNIKLIIE